MKINVKPQGVPKLKRSLQSRMEALTHLKPYWEAVGAYVQRQTLKERFGKEQASDGTKWKPLAPSTRMRRLKRHKKGNMRILQDTGELRRSVRYQAEDWGVCIGSNLKYSRTHQFGRGKIPARPFLGVTPSEREHIISMLRQYIKRHVLGGG